jgi:hypothetical protein
MGVILRAAGAAAAAAISSGVRAVVLFGAMAFFVTEPSSVELPVRHEK